MQAVDVLHVDGDVLAVNKPPGLFVHRTGLGPDRDVLLTRARDAVGRHVYPVHRLDRPASGIVLFGLSPEAARALHAALGAPDAWKLYVGLARGVIPEVLSVTRPLTSLRTGQPQAARTDLRRLGAFAGCSLVEAHPVTGRRHQIRRHLAGTAHHLIGDVEYGKGRINRLFRETYGLVRLALHAWCIEIAHPSHGGRLRVHAPLGPDLLGPLRSMPGFGDEMLPVLGPTSRREGPAGECSTPGAGGESPDA